MNINTAEAELKVEFTETLSDMATHLSGFRTAPPDMLAYLWDADIRRTELEQIAQYLHENWPDVVRVSAGMHPNRPYFRVETTTRDSSRRYWPMERCLKDTYPGLDKFTFFFHGSLRLSARATLIFPVATSPRNRTDISY